MPSIWGIERTSDKAYTTLYEKGSLLLIELENKLGPEKMEVFLRLLIDKSIDNTADFLEELEEFSSPEIRDWFESELKK
jgi:aminopeptidase N